MFGMLEARFAAFMGESCVGNSERGLGQNLIDPVLYHRF